MILTEVIKLLICLVMQFKVIAGEVAAGTAGKPSPHHGSLAATHSSSSSAASLRGGAGQAGGQGVLAREVRRQARDIAAKSLPMLLPAGMFVMQQVRERVRSWDMGSQEESGLLSSCQLERACSCVVKPHMRVQTLRPGGHTAAASALQPMHTL